MLIIIIPVRVLIVQVVAKISLRMIISIWVRKALPSIKAISNMAVWRVVMKLILWILLLFLWICLEESLRTMAMEARTCWTPKKNMLTVIIRWAVMNRNGPVWDLISTISVLLRKKANFWLSHIVITVLPIIVRLIQNMKKWRIILTAWIIWGISIMTMMLVLMNILSSLIILIQSPSNIR